LDASDAAQTLANPKASSSLLAMTTAVATLSEPVDGVSARQAPQRRELAVRKACLIGRQTHPTLTLKQFSPDRDLARLGVLGLGQG